MTIDYKEWNVPTKWEEITLAQFEKIQKFYEGEEERKTDIRDIVHILCNKTVDEVNELPAEFLNIILDKLSFTTEKPEMEEPSNNVEIDGVTYQVNIMEKMKTGEYVATEMIMKNDKNDLAGILAVLCRKEGEVYDSKFENEVLAERKNMFLAQPVTKVLPVCAFFLDLWMASEGVSRLYTALEENINRIAQNIQSSRKLGLGRKLYMKWQIRKLRKSLKSIKST